MTNQKDEIFVIKSVFDNDNQGRKLWFVWDNPVRDL